MKTDSTLTAKLAELPTLPMDVLWALWDAHFRSRPSHHNRDYVESRIAFKLQEHIYGGIKPAVRASLEQLGESQSRLKTARHTSSLLTPGTVLLREYAEVEHRVVVTPDNQYEWCGKRFNSLSAAARAITGTAWSGPLFFGLKKSGVKK